MQHVKAALKQLRRVRRARQEIRNALPGDSAVCDQIIEMLDDVVFRQHREISGQAGRWIDPSLLDDLPVIRRATLNEGDKATKFLQLRRLELFARHPQIAAVVPKSLEP